jgi:hypothetical protein
MECTNPKTGAVEDMCEQGKCECISKAQLGEECTGDLKNLGDSLSVMVCDSGLQCLDATGMACDGNSGDMGCTCDMMSDGPDEYALAQSPTSFRYTCDELFHNCLTRRCIKAPEDKKANCNAMCNRNKSICDCRRPAIIKVRTVCRPMDAGKEKAMCYNNTRTQFRNCVKNSNEVDVGAADDLELKLIMEDETENALAQRPAPNA